MPGKSLRIAIKPIVCCAFLLLAHVGVSLGQVPQNKSSRHNPVELPFQDTASAERGRVGPRSPQRVDPQAIASALAPASSSAVAPVVGGIVGAGAGAWLFSGMAGLGDRDAETKDYLIGAVIGAAVGASIGLLIEGVGGS